MRAGAFLSLHSIAGGSELPHGRPRPHLAPCGHPWVTPGTPTAGSTCVRSPRASRAPPGPALPSPPAASCRRGPQLGLDAAGILLRLHAPLHSGSSWGPSCPNDPEPPGHVRGPRWCFQAIVDLPIGISRSDGLEGGGRSGASCPAGTFLPPA